MIVRGHQFKPTYDQLFRKHLLNCSCGIKVPVVGYVDTFLLLEREEYLVHLMMEHLSNVLIYDDTYYGFRII